jgi:enoyl-CoA hydratase/carnithine racemase
MAYETLIVTREESFAVVTLNRPPANAINEQLMRELDAALTALEKGDVVFRDLIERRVHRWPPGGTRRT